jgi:AraC family transcriptional activator of pobA
MDSVHETFFEEVKSGNYDTVLPCNEVVVFGIDTDKCKEYKVAPMSCDSFCIIIVTDGTAKLSVNYSVEELRKNSMAFLMPNMVMSLSNADNGFKMKGVCFTPAYFDDLSSYAPVYNQMNAFMGDNVMPIQSLSENEMECMKAMLNLYKDINIGQLHYNGLLQHLSNLLLLRFAEILRSGCMSDTSKVSHSVEIYREFRKLLINNYLKEHYIQFYSSQLSVSPTYLSRIVRKISGRTVNEHIARMLITEARRLLDCTDMTVKQISYRLGFSDQAAFGKFFRNQFGTSPTAYRSCENN